MSVMTSMDIWLVQETARGSRRGGDPRFAVERGTPLSWFSGREGEVPPAELERCPLSASPGEESLAPSGLVQRVLVLLSLTCTGQLLFPWDDVLLHHSLRCGGSVSASAIATASLSCFAHARSSRNPATPRCAAAGAFALHDTTTSVSSRLTVRVDRKKKWHREVAVCGGWGAEEEGGLEKASALRRPCGRPARGPSGALLVLVQCLTGAFTGPFGDRRSPVARGALRTTIMGEGGDDSQRVNRVIDWWRVAIFPQ